MVSQAFGIFGQKDGVFVFQWLVQSTKISKNIDLSVFKIVRSSLSLQTSRIRLEKLEHRATITVNEKQWFRYIPSAYVSRHKLIQLYLNPKRSMLKPYHEVRNGGSRHEKVMTNFTMNTDSCAPLYMQSSDKSCVTRYSLSFPYPFVFSQRQTTFIQWSALECLLHLRNRIKKNGEVQADLSVPPCSKNFYVM